MKEEIQKTKVRKFRVRSRGTSCGEIITDDGHYLISSDFVVAYIDTSGQVFLDPKYWAYSWAVSKHRIAFLGEITAVTMRKIRSNVYFMKDLNL